VEDRAADKQVGLKEASGEFGNGGPGTRRFQWSNLSTAPSFAAGRAREKNPAGLYIKPPC
jgi:hypothetical protein